MGTDNLITGGRGNTVLYSWAISLNLHSTFSTQEYKWVPVN